MKKRMLADVLWEAANEYLSPVVTAFDAPPLEFSCNAAIVAEAGGISTELIYETHQGKRGCKTMSFLRTLGCEPAESLPWPWIHGESARQGVRYMWLLLAMHVAEDEGIEV